MGDQAAEEIAGRRAHGTPRREHRGRACGGGRAVAAASDTELAGGLAAGDQDALAELYDRYAGLAYGVAIRVLGDPGRAEDAVQEAFMNVWNHATSFDAERGSLRGWLLTAVRNRAIDYLRGRGGQRRQEEELPPEMPDPSGISAGASDPWREVALSLERGAVRDALANLPAEQRQVIELAYFGGYTHVEISSMTRLPLGTVKGRMRLGMEKMSSYLRGRGLVDV